MADPLLHGTLLCRIAVADRPQQHMDDLLQIVSSLRGRSYPIDISGIYFLENLNRSCRTGVMAFIHNDHSIGIDPFTFFMVVKIKHKKPACTICKKRIYP